MNKAAALAMRNCFAEAMNKRALAEQKTDDVDPIDDGKLLIDAQPDTPVTQSQEHRAEGIQHSTQGADQQPEQQQQQQHSQEHHEDQQYNDQEPQEQERQAASVVDNDDVAIESTTTNTTEPPAATPNANPTITAAKPTKVTIPNQRTTTLKATAKTTATATATTVTSTRKAKSTPQTKPTTEPEQLSISSATTRTTTTTTTTTQTRVVRKKPIITTTPAPAATKETNDATTGTTSQVTRRVRRSLTDPVPSPINSPKKAFLKRGTGANRFLKKTNNATTVGDSTANNDGDAARRKITRLPPIPTRDQLNKKIKAEAEAARPKKAVGEAAAVATTTTTTTATVTTVQPEVDEVKRLEAILFSSHAENQLDQINRAETETEGMTIRQHEEYLLGQLRRAEADPQSTCLTFHEYILQLAEFYEFRMCNLQLSDKYFAVCLELLERKIAEYQNGILTEPVDPNMLYIKLAMTHNALGMKAQNRGSSKGEAEAFFQRAIAILDAVDIASTGPFNERKAALYKITGRISILSNIFNLYLSRQKFDEAKVVLNEITGLREVLATGREPDQVAKITGPSVYQRAVLYVAKNKIEKAKKICHERFEQLLQAFGPDSPELCELMYQISQLHISLSEFKEAEEVLLRASCIAQSALLVERTFISEMRVINFLERQAEVAVAQGKIDEAIAFLERALGVVEGEHALHKSYALHLLTAIAFHYSTIKHDFEAADRYFKRGLEIQQRDKVEDAGYSMFLVHYAENLCVLGKHAEAELMLKKALQIRQQCFGETHPLIGAAYDSMARLYSAKKEQAKVEECYHLKLKVAEELHASKPELFLPMLIDSMTTLATWFHKSWRYDEAIQLYRRMVELQTSAPHNRDGDTDPTVRMHKAELAALEKEKDLYEKRYQKHLEKRQKKRKEAKEAKQREELQRQQAERERLAELRKKKAEEAAAARERQQMLLAHRPRWR